MNTDDKHKYSKNCQLQNFHSFDAKALPIENNHIFFRGKLALKRLLSPKLKRWIKKNILVLFSQIARNRQMNQTINARNIIYQPGDKVRIRTKEEIYQTLDMWKECHGCSFMTEMEKFCGTYQTVLKPVERFLDERDYKIKSVKGIVILKGLHCNGIEGYGRCDRNCNFFWRVEWLEKMT